ncbi:MAG: S46 family peptidase [Marinifilaceae bacterium]|jgi:hypothetical protein|nr:S46 family peptidase [Marinifilaceae bacterium]
MKLKFFLLGIVISLASVCKADGGLWIPSLIKRLKIEDMHKAGLKLSAEEIYSINQKSLKDAVMGISYGTNPASFSSTASFISETGLVITNHHCAISALHKLSTSEHNYLKNGFYAESMDKELYAKGLKLSRVIRIEDVTKKLSAGLTGLSERDSINRFNSRAKKIVDKEITGKNYYAKIRSYFGGAQYLMEVYEVYHDVRVVAAPPIELARFGGEEDNWQWPRHSADFAILRVYADKENKSIEHSKENSPYKPVNFLKVSKKGYKQADYAMILGFPGTTKQYVTSRAMKQVAEIKNHYSVMIRGAKLDVINKNRESNEDLWLKYADVMAKSSNVYLRDKAEKEAIERFNLVEAKAKQEKEYLIKLKSDKKLFAKYGNLIDSIANCVDQLDKLEKLNTFVMEAGISGAPITSFCGKFDMLNALARRKAKDKRVKYEQARLREEIRKFYDQYDINVEKQIVAALAELYDKNIDGKYYKSSIFNLVKEKADGDYNKFADYIFENSFFSDKWKLRKFVDEYTHDKISLLQNDPVFKLSISYYLINRDQIMRQRMKIRKKYGKFHKQYIHSLSELANGDLLASDANRSLRVSYGNILPLKTTNETYSYYTNLEELLVKHTKQPKLYSLPETFVKSIKEMSTKKRENTHICFISNVHTTGGNSGSAVLDSKGRLIGLNFDRASYGVISDYVYIPEAARQISVDVRYIKFILEDYLKADNLVKEIW